MTKRTLEDRVVLFNLKKTLLVKRVQRIGNIYHEVLLLKKIAD